MSNVYKFGRRPKKALQRMDTKVCQEVATSLLDLASDCEQGRLAHIVVIAKDVEGEPCGFASYNQDAAASVFRSLDDWRRHMIGVYNDPD